MVKNTQGGKHKNQARKDTYVRKTATRLSTEGEKYAIVDKLYGGGRCKVVTVDNLELMCTIRGKFTGKYKRSNTVSQGAFVLVGLREWESSPANCDLIEIYDNSDMATLMTIPAVAAFLTPQTKTSDVVFDIHSEIIPETVSDSTDIEFDVEFI